MLNPAMVVIFLGGSVLLPCPSRPRSSNRGLANSSHPRPGGRVLTGRCVLRAVVWLIVSLLDQLRPILVNSVQPCPSNRDLASSVQPCPSTMSQPVQFGHVLAIMSQQAQFNHDLAIVT